MLPFLGKVIETSEAKVTLVCALWALAHLAIPSIPLALPPIDLTAVGMGLITPSPAILVVYVIGRLIVKAVTPGSIPFWPDKNEAKEGSDA